jgi:hypothetical protein
LQSLILIGNQPIKAAQAAIAALEPDKTDKNLWQQVQSAVQQRKDAHLIAKANPSLAVLAQKKLNSIA